MKPTREEVLAPKWAGQFDSFVKWINHASIWLQSPSQQPAVCIDAKGRRCSTGKDFMRARDEDTFPVRYFWEFEVVDSVHVAVISAKPDSVHLAVTSAEPEPRVEPASYIDYQQRKGAPLTFFTSVAAHAYAAAATRDDVLHIDAMRVALQAVEDAKSGISSPPHRPNEQNDVVQEGKQ